MNRRASDLSALIARAIGENPEVVCSVATRWPDGQEFFHDADHLMHPASTVKVALMTSVLRMRDAGALKLTDRLLVHNHFDSLVTGQHFSVDPEGDTDAELHGLVGRHVTVWNLTLRMIRISSNLATNLLLEHVTANRVAHDLHEIGVNGVELKRGMDDLPAFKAGVINLASVRGLLSLATSIQENRAASRRSCFVMRQAMFLVQHPFGLAQAATGGWGVAHKPGWITGHYHDFGMLYAPDAKCTYLAVMTRGMSEDGGRQAVADIARFVKTSS